MASDGSPPLCARSAKVTSQIYSAAVGALLALGPPPGFRSPWLDYIGLGLADEHVHELIRMCGDPQLNGASGDTPEVWAPVHAWRALGQLRASAAIVPLLDLLCGEDPDDWVLDEIPDVLAMIGSTTLPELLGRLKDRTIGVWARVGVIGAMRDIARAEPQRRDDVVATLSKQLSKWYRQDETVNGFLVSSLIDLQANEALPVIEEAFGGNRVDLAVAGDWEDVQIEFGVLSERLTARPAPSFWPRPLPSSPVVTETPKGRKPDVKAKRKASRKARRQNRRRR